jgi:hypothetical protein
MKGNEAARPVTDYRECGPSLCNRMLVSFISES